jgi:DNA-binding winged helix-turn-helix (wHTH) protein/Tol biopolymer transport system component
MIASMDQSSTPGYEFRGFRLDTTLQVLISPAGDPIPLPSRAFDALHYLVERAGELVDKGALMKAVWPKSIVEENNLSQCILTLRKALGETAGERRFILTVPGRGFKFVAPVTVVPNLPPLSGSSISLPDGAPAAPSQASASVGAREAVSGSAQPQATGRRRWMLPAAIGVVALGAASIVAVLRLLGSGTYPVTLPAEYEALTDVTDSTTAPVLSPDGHMLAFIRGGEPFLSSGQIWLQVLPHGEPVQLTSEHATIFAPTFTPDGTRVAYTVTTQSASEGSWNTWTVPVTGGAPSLLLPNASGLSYIGPHEVMYSEFKTGIHLGIVASQDDRSRHREVYLPSHVRGMAHYSYLSPDRKSVLVVEMSGAGEFQRCRLVPFDGHSGGVPVGPNGSCLSATWSADGKWMYFAAKVAGRSHVWRQRSAEATPEQITFGPTDEQTVAQGPEGRSLLASIGLVQSTLWIHDKRGERKLTTESYASSPRQSADGRRIYFLTARSSNDAPELWSVDVASGRKEPLVTGFSVTGYAISHDGRRVAFTTKRAGTSEIWLAPLDRSAAPKLLLRGGDEVAFDRSDRVYFRSLGEHANYLHRIGSDGSGNARVLASPIISLNDVAQDGDRLSVDLPLENGLGASWLVPVGAGEPWLLGKGFYRGRWSQDGRLLYVEDWTSTTPKTIAVPIGENGLPAGPLSEALTRGAFIPHAGLSLSLGSDPDEYVFVQTEQRRNIYRIPLH